MSTQGPNDILAEPFPTIENDPTFDIFAEDVCPLFGDSVFLPSITLPHKTDFTPHQNLYEEITQSTANTTSVLFPLKPNNATVPNSTTLHQQATINDEPPCKFSEDSDADSDPDAIDCNYDVIKINSIKNKILSAKKAILEFQIKKNEADSIENTKNRQKEKKRLSGAISRRKNAVFSLKQELKIMHLVKQNLELRERVAKLEQALISPNETTENQPLLFRYYQAKQFPQTGKNTSLVPHSALKRPCNVSKNYSV
ncbi:MAG TPA: hypothetical protein PLD88_07375 [Candidatus Berkiella sp.]|nr:hypothetical protein [Candidatus Berkiella sp.]